MGGVEADPAPTGHPLLALLLVRTEAGLDRGAADHAQSRMWADEVEVVDTVAESVHVCPRLDPVADLEPEVGAALPVPVHRLQPHLHHGLRDRTGVVIASAV